MEKNPATADGRVINSPNQIRFRSERGGHEHYTVVTNVLFIPNKMKEEDATLKVYVVNGKAVS